MNEEPVTEASRRHSVFIAYAHADRLVADMVADSLESVGIGVGKAGGGAGGGAWRNAIEQSLKTSDYFLPIVSHASAASGHFAEEVLRADFVRELSDRAIKIIPIVLDRADVPTPLRGILYLDFTGDPDTAMKRLLDVFAPVVDIDFAALSPEAFEDLVADFLVAVGRKAERDVVIDGREYDFVIPPSDTGLFAEPGGGGWIVQVKHRTIERTSAAMIREMVAATAVLRERGYTVALVTSSQLTSAAREIATRAAIHLVEGVELQTLLIDRPDLVRKHFRQQRL